MGRLILALMLFAAPGYAATTHIAASCSRTDVGDKIAEAGVVNGDTVIIPPGDCTWNTVLNITKGITLRAATMGTLNALTGRPVLGTSPTVIRDNITGTGSLINWTLVAGYAHRLSGIEFQKVSVRSPITGPININGTNQGATSFRMDHNYVDLYGLVLSFSGFTAGVVDHNVLIGNNTLIQFWGLGFYGPAGEVPPVVVAGTLEGGNASWEYPAAWGAGVRDGVAQWMFVENNQLTVTGSERGCTDAYRGARFVFRFNDTTSCTGGVHGTDSTQFARGTRAVEFYKNNITMPTGTRNYVYENRDGTSYVWGNTANNFSVSGQVAVHHKNYRANVPYSPWGGVNGYNIIDQNPANPINPGAWCPANVCTVTSASSLTASVSGASWTPNEYASYGAAIQYTGGFVIRQLTRAGGTLPCSDLEYSGANRYVCYSPIASNTGTQITFQGILSEPGFITPTFAVDDTFEIVRVTQALDQTGVTGGGQWTNKTSASCTVSGGTVTCAQTGHGLMDNDWVLIYANTPATGFEGPRQITTSGANAFTYSCTYCTGSTTAIVTKVPNGFAQTIDPALAWNNTNLKSAVTYDLLSDVNLGTSIRENEHFFQRDPAKTFDGTIATNRSAIGSGTTLPATCTPGANGGPFFWDEDAGSWNQSGSGDQGQLYKCTGVDTWTLYYTPYTYPHPLILAEAFPGTSSEQISRLPARARPRARVRGVVR